MTPLGWSHLDFAEMIANSIIATLWAFAAWDIARRRDPLLAWPLRWRWVTTNWFWTKAALFWAITISLVAVLPFWIGQIILNLFTLAHIWAFWRWLHLPDAPPRRLEDEPDCPTQ